ncbi:sugar kinase [Bowmanella dokdonensis]|uniref:Sugar kinase n=1 Tax=Bowmanella dokdonensis TaxID=751969 RepID=A0A939DR58_9ALTE|nr:sugar kinase [Bowmanella dokdonensis]MBN7827153.1 sugar kinase [Bowmanella dokdonensis]
MAKIYFLGECLVELRELDDATMAQSFAGDVYNSAVYLKRCFPKITVSMVTAIGSDRLSEKMLTRFKSENLDTQLVFRHPSKVAGMYLIETDDAGERRFTYWRNDSAARKVVEFLSDGVVDQLATADMFFFSGIPLAIIEKHSRNAFWQKLESLKQAGVKLVFDPNYRSQLWAHKEDAIEQFDRAFHLSDIALPGVEDLTVLYGIESAQEAVGFCQQYDLEEIVVKDGPKSVVTLAGTERLSHQISPVTNVIDTTSAGDAFNGVYLGARLSGRTIAEAVQLGAKAAGTVIQHPGAIAPLAAFKQAMSEAGI